VQGPLVFVALDDDFVRHIVAVGLIRDGLEVVPVATMAGLVERMSVELAPARRRGRDFVVVADARFAPFSPVDLLELLRRAGEGAPVLIVGDLREADLPRVLDASLLPGRPDAADVQAAVAHAMAAARRPQERTRRPPRPLRPGEAPQLPLRQAGGG